MHVGDVAARRLRLARLEILDLHEARPSEDFNGVIHAPLVVGAEQYDIAQLGQSGAHQLTARHGLELRHELIEHVDVRGVAVLAYHAEGVYVGIGEQVFQLAHFIVRVDRDKPRS